MPAKTGLNIVMAINEKTAIVRAINGNAGYRGTLNGLTSVGSDFLSLITEIIEIMYKESAPNTEMVMISAVFPVSKATMPMIIFTINAFAGVLNFE